MKGTTVVLRKGPYDSLEKVEFLQTLAYGLLETLADLLLMVYDLMEIGEVLVTLVSDLLETMAHLDLSVYYLMETLVSPEKVGLHLEPDCYLEELPTTHNCLFFALQLQPSALALRSLCLLGTTAMNNCHVNPFVHHEQLPCFAEHLFGSEPLTSLLH